MRSALSVLALLALTGCASVPGDTGELPIPNGAEIARSVELCKSNIADLQARLGPPSRDGVLGRSRIMTWIVAWEPLVNYLGVMADASGTVVDVYWNLPSEVTWLPANRCT